MSQILRLDPELAAKAESLFLELGLDLSTAVHLFLRQSLRENGLPFTPRLGKPSTSPASETQRTDDSRTAKPAVSAAQENDALRVSNAVEPEQSIVSPRDMVDALTLDADLDDELEGEHLAPTMATEDKNASASESIPAPSSSSDDDRLSDPRQVFHDMQIIGAPLRRIRSLNQLYAIGEANPHVKGWREVYVSGDEPFALDFGSVRVELGWQNGGSIRMMDGRLPDEVLESDAIFPRELSPVFSSVIGQSLVDVSSTRVRRGNKESEQLRLRFANGSTLTFSPGENWCALWLSDAHGSVMYAPDAVWRRVLGERSWQTMR